MASWPATVHGITKRWTRLSHSHTHTYTRAPIIEIQLVLDLGQIYKLFLFVRFLSTRKEFQPIIILIAIRHSGKEDTPTVDFC